MNEKWLTWAKKLQSISQAGLEYSRDPYDRERFQQLRDLSVEILSQYTEVNEKKIRELFANESGYQTPKVDVRAAVFNNKGQILMVKEKLDGRWSLPGGWADIELSISENSIKETLEEAGVHARPKRIIAALNQQKYISSSYPYSIYKIFVECDYLSGEFSENIETSDQGFFPSEGIPELSKVRNTKEQISMCFKARNKEILEAFFD